MNSDRIFFKRDISWLSFNYRVLLEAKNKNRPIYDRIKFLSIFSSNLEEFYKIRISEHRGIITQENNDSISRIRAQETLYEINQEVSRQMQDFFSVFRDEILPEMEKNNIILYQGEQPLIELHRAFIRKYFYEEIFPFLQPVLILKEDISSFLRDNRLYLAIKLCKKKNQEPPYYALIKVPFSKVPRFITLPSIDNTHYLMFVDDAIGYNLDIVFPGFVIDSYYSIRVSRDADFSIDPRHSYDLVEEIRKNVKKRKTGRANRMVYNYRMPQDMLQYLCETYHIPKSQCIPAGRYLTLEDLIKLPNPGHPELSSPPFFPMRVSIFDRSGSMFKVIKQQDILLYYPYQSFDYLIRFLTEAAYDPKVDEIKITQYRVAEDSAVVNALIAAAKNGKRVTVFVELKARFDEENNIATSERMQKAGVKIIFSTPGLKVHAKVALILRRSENGENVEKSFAYLSTGNFNEKTAKIYSDMGLFTYNTTLIQDLNLLFNVLEGKATSPHFDQLLVSQFNMLPILKEKIAHEIELARQGKAAYIILKMNGLQDEEMIRLLYDASEAGVKIDLIIRGICCLVPNQSYSQNIRIIRIIDEFLEHARIWYFNAEGKEEVFLSSADWMKRNLNRRIETAFPILDKPIKQKIIITLKLQLQDNTQACIINEHLQNIPIIHNTENPIRAQQKIYELLKNEAESIIHI
ncbi:polyphosphate kinase 1 [Coprobacter sp.]